MRTYRIILTLILLSDIVLGQTNKTNFEFGLTLATGNPIVANTYMGIDRPRIEYLNGLFCRYTQNKIGLRAFASYTKFKSTTVGPSTFATSYSGYGQLLDCEDLKIGLGVQYALSAKCKWFYSFADLAYNKIIRFGSVYDSPAGWVSYSQTIEAIKSHVGIGARINLLKAITLSPEISYSLSFRQTQARHSLLPVNNIAIFNGHPVVKLQLTYTF